MVCVVIHHDQHHLALKATRPKRNWLCDEHFLTVDNLENNKK